jgi:hypothetical protein
MMGRSSRSNAKKDWMTPGSCFTVRGRPTRASQPGGGGTSERPAPSRAEPADTDVVATIFVCAKQASPRQRVDRRQERRQKWWSACRTGCWSGHQSERECFFFCCRIDAGELVSGSGSRTLRFGLVALVAFFSVQVKAYHVTDSRHAPISPRPLPATGSGLSYQIGSWQQALTSHCSTGRAYQQDLVMAAVAMPGGGAAGGPPAAGDAQNGERIPPLDQLLPYPGDFFEIKGLHPRGPFPLLRGMLGLLLALTLVTFSLLVWWQYKQGGEVRWSGSLMMMLVVVVGDHDDNDDNDDDDDTDDDDTDDDDDDDDDVDDDDTTGQAGSLPPPRCLCVTLLGRW